MTLSILKKGNPILIEGAKIIVENPKSDEIKRLISDMKETMEKNDGVGLAANQVGQQFRLFVLGYEKIFKVFINPKIKKYSSGQVEVEEGCLSVPGIFGIVKRPEKVLIEALNENGNKVEYWAEGLEARIIQHEIDHLNGILFVDRAKNLFTFEQK